MFLVRLVYASRKSPDFNESDIEQLLASARKHNLANHVTGLLCFNRKYFLQCLEGSRARVNATYHNILNDPRHNDIVMLDYREVDSRKFDAWSMGYMPESSLTTPLNLRYSGTPEFDPYDMSGESAYQMMLELGATVPVI
ncbi:BLUF domain-containing protein [Oceanicoccus sagamiensis]|uniref:Blue light sensor protein n=1 Tax=Oceanicoccus sagamiensis TaxID=716816 RepID=A0A1X9NG81_9GAMM|nr:BLUF domain-containing protein [Oceanicoccus sagamiensis]ARN73013.1 blue light sensor protein [Oceanicoccus sagamiensis]